MFNRTFIQAGPSHVTHSTIEKRAPTDESVRLLKEFEQEARAKVLASVSVGDTKFECRLHLYEDHLSGDMVVNSVFSLNGYKCQVETRINQLDRLSPESKIDRIRNDVANRISQELLRSSFDFLDTRRLFG